LGLVGSRTNPQQGAASSLMSDNGDARPGSRQPEQPRHERVSHGSRPLDQIAERGTGPAAGLALTDHPDFAARSDQSDHSHAASDSDASLSAALERLERQVAVAMARARESVVALEYTAADAPAGTRRIATGVVVNQRGEVLSVKIDPLVRGEPEQA